MDQNTNQTVSSTPVTIYSTPSCTYCHAAKEFFKANNIPYNDYNVADNLEKREEMSKLTGGQMAVPVIVVGTNVIVGFNEGKLRELLQIA